MNWYIAQIHGKAIGCAMTRLKALGFEAWYPRAKEYRIVRNKRVIVEHNKLIDYVFFRGAPPELAREWKPMITDGDWTTVTDAELAPFMRREKAPVFVTFARNTPVRIASGPLQGLTGAVQRAKPHLRKVRVSFVGKGILELDIGLVEAI